MTTGVDITEISNRTKATKSKTVSGVAGRSMVYSVLNEGDCRGEGQPAKLDIGVVRAAVCEVSQWQ